MIGDPVYVWDDRLNQRVVIGYSVWDGRELLPNRPQVPDPRFAQRARRAGDRHVVRDVWESRSVGRPEGPALKCRCGRVRSRKADRCRTCYHKLFTERSSRSAA